MPGQGCKVDMVSRCGLRDRESRRDLMQRSRRVRLEARSRLVRVSRGEDRRRMGWSLASGPSGAPRTWDGQWVVVVVCDGVSESLLIAMRCGALDA